LKKIYENLAKKMSTTRRKETIIGDNQKRRLIGGK